jgi:O-antigen ligase
MLRYLIYTLPFFIFFSNGFANFAIIAISTVFLYEKIKIKDFTWMREKYFIAGVLFCIYLTANSLLNLSKSQFFNSIFWIRYIFCTAAIHNYFLDHRNKRYEFFKLLEYIVLFVVFNNIMQYFLGYDLFGNVKFDGTRLTAISGKPNAGSLLLFAGLPILTTWFNRIFLKESLRIKILNIMYFLCYSLVILLSGERVVAAQFLAATLFAFFFTAFKHNSATRKNYARQLQILVILLPVLIIIAISAINNKNFQDRFNLTIKQMSNLPNTAYGMIFETSYEVWKNNKIFGVGIRNYKNVCSKYMKESLSPELKEHGCGNHSHNFYLEILSETGILGFAFCVLISLVILFDITRKLFNKTLITNHVLFGLILSFLIKVQPINITPSFWASNSVGFTWIAIGLIYAIINSKKSI